MAGSGGRRRRIGHPWDRMAAAQPHLGQRRPAVSWLLALAFLIGALIPSLHGAPVAPRLSSEFAAIEAALGDSAESLLTSICHHDDGSSSGLPDGEDHSQCKKLCLLCHALQHSAPALAQAHSIALTPYRTSAAGPIPQNSPPAAMAMASGQARPRAPPLG